MNAVSAVFNIIALAFLLVSRYEHDGETRADARTKSALQRIALAETNLDTDPETGSGYVSLTGANDLENLKTLARFGFRPDPRVAFAVIAYPVDYGYGIELKAVAAFNSPGSRAFLYDFNGGKIRFGPLTPETWAEFQKLGEFSLNVYKWDDKTKTAKVEAQGLKLLPRGQDRMEVAWPAR